jgi:hypothetical protein
LYYIVHKLRIRLRRREVLDLHDKVAIKTTLITVLGLDQLSGLGQRPRPWDHHFRDFGSHILGLNPFVGTLVQTLAGQIWEFVGIRDPTPQPMIMGLDIECLS